MVRRVTSSKPRAEWRRGSRRRPDDPAAATRAGRPSSAASTSSSMASRPRTTARPSRSSTARTRRPARTSRWSTRPRGVPPNDLPSQPAVFAPDYAPEEIAEIARKLRDDAGLSKGADRRRGERRGRRQSRKQGHLTRCCREGHRYSPTHQARAPSRRADLGTTPHRPHTAWPHWRGATGSTELSGPARKKRLRPAQSSRRAPACRRPCGRLPARPGGVQPRSRGNERRRPHRGPRGIRIRPRVGLRFRDRRRAGSGR